MFKFCLPDQNYDTNQLPMPHHNRDIYVQTACRSIQSIYINTKMAAKCFIMSILVIYL